MPKRLRWTKYAPGEWHGYELNNTGAVGTEVAVAAKTGTHLDDYPWDWYFTQYGSTLVPDEPTPCSDGAKCNHGPRAHKRHHAGTVDTLRAAKSAVEWNLASAGDAVTTA